MQWDRLKIFYHVANCGSFTKTGKQLHLSQSAISRQIIDLEYRLKQKLFYREARGLSLTDSGKILLKSVEKIFSEIETAKTLINDHSKEPQGSLKITSAAGWISTLLLPNLNDFLLKYPKLHISLVCADYEMDMLFGMTDVAILSYLPDHPNLTQKYLMKFNLGLYASPKYLNDFGRPETIKDLGR